MGDKKFDLSAFKAQQREQWSNVAEGWRRRWPVFEQGAQSLSDQMLELASGGIRHLFEVQQQALSRAG